MQTYEKVYPFGWLGLLAASGVPATLWVLGPLLFVFFCGFNALEASQPSLVSRMAPAPVRGAALGSYNTLQSLGLFAGGALGGALVIGALGKRVSEREIATGTVLGAAVDAQ